MNQVKKELKRFLVVGVSAVTIDLTTYYLLLDFLSHDIAKAISFLLGTIFAFVINKYWTFEKHKKSYTEVFQFGVLYSVTLGVNVLTNKMVIDNTQMVFLAFLMATGASTVLNFIGQKWWVFR